MEFLSWHYSKGIDFYLNSWLLALRSVEHYFSPSLLIKTLFAPWKRLIVIDTSPGFNVQKKFEAFTFNFISRGIGAIVRLVLFGIGITSVALTFLSGASGFLFWLILPFLGSGVYSKWKRQPANFINDLMQKIKKDKVSPLKLILETNAGKFILAHAGITIDKLLTEADEKKISFDDFVPTSFEEIFSRMVKAKVWKDEFFSKAELAPMDMAIIASWWDKKTSEETKLLKENFGRPGLALDLTFGYTPTLSQYSSDLSSTQDYSHRLIGRGQIVSRMERILSSGNSVMLIGAPGVGRKTVVLEFARRASVGELGPSMSYHRILEFDYNSLLSRAVDINQKKTELALSLAEAEAAGNIILMVRDIQRLIHPDIEGYDFTDIFETYLEKRRLKIIAISTNVEFERFISSNARLGKFLEKVEVISPTKEEAMEILIEAASRWEKMSGVTITINALRNILEESDRYVTEVPYPEKAIELLDAVVTYCEQNEKTVVTIEDTNAILAEKTGISFAKLSKEEIKKLTKIEEVIHERLIDQKTAISLIGKSLRAKTVGVIKEKRPLGSFLFLGPTGVGKTETAKVLAKVYYGDEENMIRFDMAEYSGSEGLERLIGSVSKNMPGALTTEIKNKPASLLLLDEIEKASRDIYNLFLALLDEGVITDAFGRKINCRNLFVIGTSNAGAEYIREQVGKGVKGEVLQNGVVDFVLEKEIFSPELLNRFDGVVVYEPLRKKDLVKIAHLMLTDLSENLKKKNITLYVDENTAVKLAEDGYDPAFGARPMRRLVNLNLGDLVGHAILSGEVKEGDKIKIVAGVGKEEFKLEKATL